MDAATATSNPFHNSVLILPAYLIDLGLTEDHAVFDYAALSQSPNQNIGEQTDWATFDAAHPLVDTVKSSPDERPLYIGDSPVMVDIAADAPAEAQKLLLLHHNNVAGERFEVVDLVPPGVGNLSLDSDTPESVAASETVASVLAVHNDGPVAASGVKLTGSVTGAVVEAVASSQGSCKTGGSVDCDLGDLDVGASATVTVTLRPSESATSVLVSATAESALACESTIADNESSVTITVDAAPKSKPKDVDAGGGCGCRVDTHSSPLGAFTLWALSLLGLGLRRRRSA